MKFWKVILATLIIFGAGVVTGGLLVSHTMQANAPQPLAFRANAVPGNPWHAQSRELLRRMDRELSLSREQRERIERIIADSQDRTRSLWKPIAPQMGKEMQSVRDSIRDELTPDQRRRFDDLFRPHPNRNGGEFSRDKEKEKDRAGDHRRSDAKSELATNPPVELPTTNPPAIKPEPHQL